MTRIKSLRWWIAGLLAFATTLSYLDRQTLPVAITDIQKHIPVSDQQYALLQMLFLLAYTVMYAGGGKIADALGTRLGYTVMIVWWSAATVLHGLVAGVFGFGVARFLLGLGEGGGYPCSSKAISEWFPPEDRSIAFGMNNLGSCLGAVIAPPMIAFLVLSLNWRSAFVITGAIGILWALIWWLFYDLPERQRLISPEELEHIQASLGRGAKPALAAGEQPIAWTGLFRYRQVWALMSAKFFSDAAWYFFVFWLPKYLGDVRHLNIGQIGYYAWIPFAVAGGGALGGGWLSSSLIRRHLSINLSRKIALGLSAAILPVSLLITESPLRLTIVFFSMALFGHQFFSTNLQTLAADIFPSSVVGSIAGLMGAMGSFGGALFGLLVGLVLGHLHSYSWLFIVAGLLHPLSFLLILLLIPRIQPVAGCSITHE
jgi:ACS family hexuronate transporter-like MFS transporter